MSNRITMIFSMTLAMSEGTASVGGFSYSDRNDRTNNGNTHTTQHNAYICIYTHTIDSSLIL